MFRAAPAAVPAVDVVPEVTPVVVEPMVPLSVLSLDLPVPVEGWALFLGKRGVAIVPDDLGRDCVTRGDARRLLDEYTADQLRKQAVLKVQEQAAVEADRVRRAQIWGGLHWTELPDGVHPAAAMLQSAKDAQPKRRSPLEESFAGETMTYHGWPAEEAS
jgi:hypothetical protein